MGLTSDRAKLADVNGDQRSPNPPRATKVKGGSISADRCPTSERIFDSAGPLRGASPDGREVGAASRGRRAARDGAILREQAPDRGAEAARLGSERTEAAQEERPGQGRDYPTVAARDDRDLGLDCRQFGHGAQRLRCEYARPVAPSRHRKGTAVPMSWHLLYDTGSYACVLGKRNEAEQRIQLAMTVGDANAIRLRAHCQKPPGELN
jgi:hypothetical protein